MNNSSIERHNFYNDSRTTAMLQTKYFDVLEERNHRALILLKDRVLQAAIEENILSKNSDGMIRTGVKYEICNLCKGSGTIVDPSIDCSGISAEDFANDPVFAEEYTAGKYNITCTECTGKRVIVKPNFSSKLLILIGDLAREDRYALKEQMAELAFGC